MRCLTLANALRERGCRCHFLCREHPGNLNDLISEQGFAVHNLSVGENMSLEFRWNLDSPVHAEWLGVDWKKDAAQVWSVISKMEIDWLIVDHYAIDANWERELRLACRKLMVIDDLADRSHECDFLLDQNLGRTEADYHGLVPDTCMVYTGPQYALLRPEFAAMRSYSLARRVEPQLRHLLITMGGVDKDNVTGKVLNMLKNCRLPTNFCITVVMGTHAPWVDQIFVQAQEMDRKIEVLSNVRDFAKLMADSDLAIGAAGSTAWERCCLGLPTLMMILADNQKQVAKSLVEGGCAMLLEDVSQVPGLIEEFLSLSQSKKLTEMQRACSSITDGGGTSRLVDILLRENGKQ